MARALPPADQFNYDEAPKGRERFPKSYMNCEFSVAEKRHGDDGRAYFYAEGAITAPHAAGTEDFDGHPVFLFWYVGTDEDPEADDPHTWMTTDKKGLDDKERGRAIGHDMTVENCIAILKAAKLTKGKGQGAAPWVLFPDLEGESVCIEFGERTGKDGVTRQTHTFHEVGAREPMIVGHRATSKREATAPPARRTREPEPEVEVEEEPEQPRRAARR